MLLKDPYRYDKLVSNQADKPCIVIGEMALIRNGLTSLLTDRLQLSTLFTDITGLYNPIATWYFNPWAKTYDYTSNVSGYKILNPTKERAIIEYIIFKDYFNEGILIEGLQTYLFQMDNNVNKLYEVADWFKIQRSLVDYWIQEALEDDYT